MDNINYLYNNYSIPFKKPNNYGKNNLINNEPQKVEKIVDEYNNVGNNKKYSLKKRNFHVLENSFKEIPISSYNNSENNMNNWKDNNRYDGNYNNDDNYNFLQKEKDHIKKVRNKIIIFLF